jgi:vacuolar-type H+-ATPase subunit H
MAKRVQEDEGQESRQALATLLAIEEQLDARLAAARDEAERIVAEGQEAARRAEDLVPALIEARTAAVTSAIQAQLTRDRASIEKQAEQAIARYDAVDPRRSPDLVTLVVSRVLEVGNATESGSPQ